MDVIGDFLEECTRREDGKTLKGEMYESSAKRSDRCGEKPISSKGFTA